MIFYTFALRLYIVNLSYPTGYLKSVMMKLFNIEYKEIIYRFHPIIVPSKSGLYYQKVSPCITCLGKTLFSNLCRRSRVRRIAGYA